MLRSKLALRTLIGILVLTTVIFIAYQFYKSYSPRPLTIVTGSDDTDFADSLARILEEVSPPIRLNIKTLASEEIPAALENKQVDLAIVQLDQNSFPQIRVVALIYPELFFLIVQPDSNIRSPADLAGKVVATRQKAAFEAVLNYYGVPINQVEIKPLHSEEAHLAFINREVDATFRWSEPTSETVRNLVQNGGRLIPLDQFDSMRLTIPYLTEYILPRGISHAANPVVPPLDLKTVGSYKALVANAKVDPTIIRTITQAIFEHQNTLVADFPLAVYLKSPMNVQMVGPYVHSGAQMYYDKDKPTFFQQYESEISFLFSAGPILATVLLALWTRMRSRQQNRAKIHIQAVQNALTRLVETNNGQDTEAVEERLLRILAQFTKDLNDGNISVADAETFSWIWEKAMAMAQNRKKLVNVPIH